MKAPVMLLSALLWAAAADCAESSLPDWSG